MATPQVGDLVEITEDAFEEAAKFVGHYCPVIERYSVIGPNIRVRLPNGKRELLVRNEYRLIDESRAKGQPNPPVPLAAKLLNEAAETITQRGKQRDGSYGERSMARTVTSFNAMTDHKLTEEDGWLFMRYLKDSRSRRGSFTEDDYLDNIAYAALQGECAIQTHTKQEA